MSLSRSVATHEEPVMSVSPTRAELQAIAVEEISGYVVEITPELAEKWLRANTDNRPIRSTHVRTLAADMASENWGVTHQGIAFSGEGRLIDGQHRLQAILKANVPVLMTVFVGLDDNTFGVLDRGIKRIIADELKIDRRFAEVCVLCAQLLLNTGSGGRSPTPQQVKTLWGAYSADLHRQIELCPTNARGRTAAPVRAAWVIQRGGLGPSFADVRHLKALEEQWRPFVLFRATEMDTTAATLARRLENRGTGPGGKLINDRLAAAWLGWDRNRECTRITVRDVGDVLGEIRVAVRRKVGAEGLKIFA